MPKVVLQADAGRADTPHTLMHAWRRSIAYAKNERGQTMHAKDVFERVESKYLLNATDYEHLMSQIGSRMCENEFSHCTISSLYYDTDTFEMISRSLEKPTYKEKLRIRAYDMPGERDAVYVELKKKFKGMVYKRRVAMTPEGSAAFMTGMPYEQAATLFPLADCELQSMALSAKSLQIAREIQACRSHWRNVAPAMMIIVRRDAYTDAVDPELRITFDHEPRWRSENLSFSASLNGSPLLPSGQLIMEIKCLSAFPLWLSATLANLHIYPHPLSKYGHAYKTVHPPYAVGASARQQPHVQVHRPSFAPTSPRGVVHVR